MPDVDPDISVRFPKAFGVADNITSADLIAQLESRVKTASKKYVFLQRPTTPWWEQDPGTTLPEGDIKVWVELTAAVAGVLPMWPFKEFFAGGGI